LQREVLPIWDCTTNRVDMCHPFLGLATADGPGMTYLNGLVGHKGKMAVVYSVHFQGVTKKENHSIIQLY